MFLTPYMTRAGSAYDTLSIIEQAKKAQVMTPDVFSPAFASGMGADSILMVTDQTPDIPGFAHPVVVSDTPRGGEVLIDARPYTTKQRDGEWKIRSREEFQGEVNRALLTQHWIIDGPTDFLALGDIPLKLYLNWIGGMVSRHLAVDPLTQWKVGALAGLFYLTLHYSGPEDLTDTQIAKMADKVARAMRGSVEDVLALAEDGLPMNVEGFVNAIRSRTESVRLENVSVAYLFNVVGGSWFGNNAKEKLAIALEHPPTWIQLVDAAMNDRTYRKSGLAQMVATFVRPTEHKDFTRSVRLLMAR